MKSAVSAVARAVPEEQMKLLFLSTKGNNLETMRGFFTAQGTVSSDSARGSEKQKNTGLFEAVMPYQTAESRESCFLKAPKLIFSSPCKASPASRSAL